MFTSTEQAKQRPSLISVSSQLANIQFSPSDDWRTPDVRLLVVISAALLTQAHCLLAPALQLAAALKATCGRSWLHIKTSTHNKK